MKKSVHAFTLVEVALALMVVAIGILAVLGMFPAGLDQGEWSAAETHAALFAEEVFNGMRALAEEDDFQGFTNMSLPLAATSMWDKLPLVELTVTNTGGTDTVFVVTNVYEYNDIAQYAVRYSLMATNIAANSNVTAVFLRVWPGEFGGTNSPVVFYTEFYRFRAQ